MNRTFLYLIWVSIFLAPFGAFADVTDDSPRREDLIRVGYDQLPEVVEFAYRSNDFQAQLTDEEKGQLRGLFQVAASIRAAEMPLPSDFPQVVAPKIEFSSVPEKFKLEPGQPERSAVTTEVLADPIFVNLRILNSKANDPTYMDVLQILVHELGHKLGKNKIQTAMDSLGAKLTAFLKPYYQHLTIDGAIRVEMLSLPNEIAPVRFGPPNKTRILLSEAGYVVYHQLDLTQALGVMQRFTPSERGFGNFMESDTFRLTNFRGSDGGYRARLTFNVELMSRMVFSIGGFQEMIPQSRLVDLVKPVSENIVFSTDVNRPYRDGIPQYYIPRTEGWDYKDATLKNRVSKAELVGNRVSIEFQKPMHSRVRLRLQTENGEILVSATSTNEDRKKIDFEIPSMLKSESGSIKISDVIVGVDSRAQLPQVLSSRVGVATTEMSVRSLQYFDGKDWRDYSVEDKVEMPEGPIRFRLQVTGDSKLQQLRLRWNSGASLYWGQPENELGTFSTLHEEVIEQLKEVERQDGRVTYEFLSTQVLNSFTPELEQSAIGARDNSKRVLKELLATSETLRTRKIILTTHLKIFNREFMRVNRGAGMACSALFRGGHD